MSPKQMGKKGKINMVYLEPRETFDAFIIGEATGFNLDENCLIYSKVKIINHLASELLAGQDPKKNNRFEELTFEMATEYFEYNIIGAYMGPNTPIFLESLNSSFEEDYVQ